MIYVLSDSANRESSLIIVKLTNDEIFGGIDEENRMETLQRILRGALSYFEPTVNIPPKWKAYHAGNFVSYMAANIHTGEKSRVCMEINCRGSKHCYFFALTKEQGVPLGELKPDHAFFDRVRNSYGEALRQPGDFEDEDGLDESEFSVAVDASIDVSRGYKYREWYDTHLTKAQRNFVDSARDGPLRVTGAAGTGKTLALVMRFLRLVYEEKENSGDVKRFAFLTHSTATSDLIHNYILNIDDQAILFDHKIKENIFIGTLHDLANEHVGYELSGIEPLALDGLEGRKQQAEWLSLAVEDFVSSDWLFRKSACSSAFQIVIEAERDSIRHKAFLYDLMNEFACVINVLPGRTTADKKKQYLRHRRANWMIPLENDTEKLVIFGVYERFNKLMQQMHAVGIDQMIADYLGFLESFKWRTQIHEQGFDYIFADEFHLFNKTERLVLPLLSRGVLSDQLPHVYLAYDPKQSPRDTFLEVPLDEKEKNIWQDSGLGHVENFSLQEVFRYTPEITAFLKALDDNFPSALFGDEWGANSSTSNLESGPLPIVQEFSSNSDMVETTVQEARAASRRCRRGAKVAVICLSYELFELYTRAGRFRGNSLPITSRDELQKIQYAGKRFVLSMPEYVAGLQFDSVFLLDANANEISQYGEGSPAIRRFVSSIYLGASRAQRNLSVYATVERGGLSDVVKSIVSQGAATLR
jgi:hypothetical protein